ncbi:MAG TPA: hypothetical protein VEI57_04110 [Nitrospirota bacterium]|nr:hypothetical protein [Nitrospirota bacterium]
MTDREAILAFRLQEAADALADAERMMESGFSPRSIANRDSRGAREATTRLFTARPR